MYKICKHFKKRKNEITDFVITIFMVSISRKSVMLKILIDLFCNFLNFKAFRLRIFLNV